MGKKFGQEKKKFFFFEKSFCEKKFGQEKKSFSQGNFQLRGKNFLCFFAFVSEVGAVGEFSKNPWGNFFLDGHEKKTLKKKLGENFFFRGDFWWVWRVGDGKWMGKTAESLWLRRQENFFLRFEKG